MIQESRRYIMFKRLNKNVIKTRITLLNQGSKAWETLVLQQGSVVWDTTVLQQGLHGLRYYSTKSGLQGLGDYSTNAVRGFSFTSHVG